MDGNKDMTLAEEKHGEEAEHGKKFCESLKESVQEEMADSGKYDDMAEWADEEYPGKGYGFILRCIAKEERSHLDLLQKIHADIKASAD